MLFCLFIAILATILWINITISEIVNTKINPYASDNGEEDMNRAKLKNYIAIIMAIFWAIIIRYN